MIDLNEFKYPKEDLNETSDIFNVDYELLTELLDRYPKVALELAIVAGYASGTQDPDTVVIKEDYEQEIEQDWMELAVLTVYDTVMNQGHSGFSFSYYLNLLVPTLRGQNIAALTGNEWEWEDCSEIMGLEPESYYSNIRCSSIFRRGPKHTPAMWSDGRIFTENGGKSWFTSSDSAVEVVFPLNTAELKPEKVYLEPVDISDDKILELAEIKEKDVEND